MGTRRALWMLIGTLSLMITIMVGTLGTLVMLYGRGVSKQLLVLDEAAQLRLVDMDGVERILVDDASNDRFRYPATSPDGRHVAYISRDGSGFALVRLNLASGEFTELYRSAENPPLYVGWSPDGRNISFLSNLRTGGLGMHIVPADGSHEATLIGASSNSFYFAWNPVGDTLLLHEGGVPFKGGRIALYYPGHTQPLSILSDSGLFQAPAWSTDGTHLFYVAQPIVESSATSPVIESILTRVAADGSAPIELVREEWAVLFFSRAPNQDLLAYTTLHLAQPGSLGISDFGPLRIVDGNGGQDMIIASRADEHVAAFFWSPDGQRLAYLTMSVALSGNDVRYTWHVVDLNDQSIRDLVSFEPSEAFASMIQFFDAYAMSFSLWSPDGQQLTYSSADGVYVIDMNDGSIRRAADGVLGLWVGQSRPSPLLGRS
jgi:TolB protein